MTVQAQERPTKARIRDVLQRAINYVEDDVDLLSRYPEEREQGERLIDELRDVRDGLDRVSVEKCHEYDKGFADAIDGYQYARPASATMTTLGPTAPRTAATSRAP